MAKRSTKKSKTITVTLVRSPIGCPERQKRTVRALGLHRINQSVSVTDNPSVRGMIDRIGHLVQVEE